MVYHNKPWDQAYNQDKKTWGDRPSELAILASNYLKECSQFKGAADIFILDLGCGYGRDAIFLAQNLPCHILGLDSSTQTIEIGRESLPKDLEKRVELLSYDFSHVRDKYDVIFTANLYHLLTPDSRIKLRQTVKRCLKAGGLLFLSALSVNDPEHFGKGTPVENETNSFLDERYLHFSTRLEMEKAFDFLDVHALFEWEYREESSTGTHHHVSWILMGKMR
jgi:cyclopropane fatty-acyl-phospholipid synthase-like methyltransferase